MGRMVSGEFSGTDEAAAAGAGDCGPDRERPAGDPHARRWRFGNSVLDERSLVLSVGGAPVKLERKPLEALLFLLEHAGELVTKDELLEAIWPGRILSETSLAKCIGRVREVLGDDAQDIIKTVHGYGYRLVMPVQMEAWVAGGAVTPEEPALAEELKRALDAAAASKAVADFLGREVLAAIPAGTPGLSVRELLEAASSRLDGGFRDRPQAAAELHAVLGQAFASVGAAERARHHLQQAMTLYRSFEGPGSAAAGAIAARLAGGG